MHFPNLAWIQLRCIRGCNWQGFDPFTKVFSQFLPRGGRGHGIRELLDRGYGKVSQPVDGQVQFCVSLELQQYSTRTMASQIDPFTDE
jgi:hypothetical protein